jgi:hypothetical protein
MPMSVFPTGRVGGGWRRGLDGGDRLEAADGVLVRPIRGQIYMIEEEDLETLSRHGKLAAPSGLVSRH